MLKNFKSLMELLKAFPNEKSCIKYMEQLRWYGSIRCAHCDNEKVYKFSDEIRYKCVACKKQFTAKVGTVFEDSKIPLQKWFVAIYLASSRKKGISSIQLGKEINCTQKTAWFILQRIREGLKDKAPQVLEGTVELDETYIGGKNKNKHYSRRKKNTQGRSIVDKVPVFGIMQRNGIVRTRKVPNTKRGTIKPIVYQNVEAGSTIYTDEWFAYRGLGIVYEHSMVDHGKYQYVNGDCYTNNIECAWSHLKRTILGTHHWTSKKHLNKYLYEFDFRYNTRSLKDDDRFNKALLQMDTAKLKYKDLTAKAA